MKPLHEILEELHELSEELRPHVEAETAERAEEHQDLLADLAAYRAEHRELRASVDRRDITIKNLTRQIEETNDSLVELAQQKALLNTAASQLEDLHALAAKLGGLLRQWEEGGGDPRDLEAETSWALQELEDLGPAPGTPVEVSHEDH